MFKSLSTEVLPLTCRLIPIYAEYMLNICRIYARPEIAITGIQELFENQSTVSPFLSAKLTSWRK